MKILLKRILFSMAARLGAVYKTGGVPVILYHSVDDRFRNSTPTRLFRKQMEYLKTRNLNVISLKELYERLVSPEPLPENAAVITFDDGIDGVLHNALPILSEFRFPATVFVVTDYVGKKISWERAAEFSSYRLCTWDQLGALTEQRVDIQSHTRTHRFLPELSDEEAAAEIQGSMEAIQHRLGTRVEFLAYPYGYYDERIKRICRECGITCAVCARTEAFGKVHKTQDLYALKRLGTEMVAGRDLDMLMNFFSASIAGTAGAYIWLRDRVPFIVNHVSRAHYAKHSRRYRE